MIERLLPSGLVAVSTRGDLADVALYPEEEAAVGRAVAKRRREFLSGRGCAREALRRLGHEPSAIPSGARGEPLWPAGVVGSITHCDGYRACVVARAGEVASVGIDAEVNRPLPPGVLAEVAFGRERQMVAAPRGELCLDRLLFSAKEAVYKAWFPLARRWLGFEDVELTIDAAAGTFHCRLLVPGPLLAGTPLTELHGRWTIVDGLLGSAVVVPHAGGRAAR
jgi:4'-phosphopantetheinyl transferase EntD